MSRCKIKHWIVYNLPGGLDKLYHKFMGQVGEEVSINSGAEAVYIKFKNGSYIWFATTQVKRVNYCFKGRSLVDVPIQVYGHKKRTQGSDTT